MRGWGILEERYTPFWLAPWALASDSRAAVGACARAVAARGGRGGTKSGNLADPHVRPPPAPRSARVNFNPLRPTRCRLCRGRRCAYSMQPSVSATTATPGARGADPAGRREAQQGRIYRAERVAFWLPADHTRATLSAPCYRQGGHHPACLCRASSMQHCPSTSVRRDYTQAAPGARGGARQRPGNLWSRRRKFPLATIERGRAVLGRRPHSPEPCAAEWEGGAGDARLPQLAKRLCQPISSFRPAIFGTSSEG